MLKTLQIQNFQSHKNTRLDFHKGVNVIVGNSDSGKTAILRALNWVINNRPSGDSFRPLYWKNDNTTVQLNIENTTIERKKGKSENTYHLNDEIFKAMGKGGIPEEIAKALNMNSINIQYQHDPPFLLSASPGEVAQYLNRMVGLDAIDRGMSNIASKARKNTQDLGYEKNKLEQANADIKEFDNLPDKEKQVIKLEILEKKIQVILEDKQKLNGLLKEIDNNEKEIKSIPDLTGATECIEKMLSTKYELDKIKESYGELETIREAIENGDRKINKLDSQLKKLKHQYTDIMPNICPLCGKGK